MDLSIRMRIGTVLCATGLVVALAASGAPAQASSSAATPSAAGRIVCGGDMCIQTVSTTKTAAKINGWANTSTFYGYMEISVPTGGGITEFQQSPIKTWPAGGTHFTFELNCYTSPYYTAQAWTYPAYDNIGTVNFTIDSC